MKKIIILLFVLLFGCCFTFNAYAEGEDEAAEPVQTVTEEPVDASQPRLMVTDYSLDTKNVQPDKESELSITLKNFSSSKAIRNIKLSLTEETGDIKILGTGTQYIDRIGTGKSYTWKLKVTAAKTAAIGEHALTVSAEYEDRYYTAYTASDMLRLNVYQTVSLDYNGVQLPVKMVQDETSSVDMTFINSGKTKIRNIKIDFDVAGLESGGTAYIGEIEPGATATASANLRAMTDMVGDTTGIATVSYEDEFGEAYTATVDLTTAIEEPVVPDFEEEEQEEQSRFPFWWAFMLGGFLLGGGIGAAIPIAVHARKQRLADEAML